MTRTRPRILLAEDDFNLGSLLADYLKADGFDVTLCNDGEMALKTFQNYPFDVCLIDLMLPKMDGFSLIQAIRKKELKIPILIISAKSLKTDKLKGYGLGVDDYITKPFDEEELLWKIKAVIRRMPNNQKANESVIISIGKFRFDHNNQSLSIGADTRRITERESDILKYLSDRRNNVIKREDLLKDLWGENDYFLGRSLDVFITKIRKYLKEDEDIKIENVFGVGFILNAPDEKK
jgi:DNA-binding response OmpR family regulator